MVTLRDLALARVAKKHGANYSLRIIMEARKAGIPISLAFALIEQESNFRNVFGHDPTTSVPASWMGKEVTKQRYLSYKEHRQAHGMQGVGPAQLTWWEYQDKADKRGGAWKPKHNISVAFEHLGSLIKNKGLRAGIAEYNGSGPAAAKYAEQVLERQARWHKRLT
jgi:hypothetical protein